MLPLTITWIALVLALGCEERRSVPVVERVDTSTPEGQFEWAMKRLERAVVEFQPSSEAGLHVGERKVTYELFPPDGQQSTYRARVVIESETAYVHEDVRDKVQQEREQRRRERAREDFQRNTSPDDPLAKPTSPIDEKFTSQMEELAAKSHPPGGPEPLIETPRVTKREEYDLEYVDGKWTLITEVESDFERLWFEYALKR